MSDDYELLHAPWHSGTEDTPLREGGAETHLVELLDAVCEHLTTAYIAENMGDQGAFNAAQAATNRYLDELPRTDLYQMAMFAVAKHATDRAAFSAREIPDAVPTEWLKGGGES